MKAKTIKSMITIDKQSIFSRRIFLSSLADLLASSFLVALAVVTLCSVSEPLYALPIPWSGDDFFIMTKGIKVAKLLEDLGANYNVAVLVSPQVNDIFLGVLKGKSPDEILENLSKLYHLSWYFDGKTLYVCKANEIKQIVLAPSRLTFDALDDILSKNDLVDQKHCRIQKVAGIDALEVIGPPAFVNKVEAIAKELDTHAEQIAKSKESFAVFPLSYASAVDQVYNYRDTTLVIPGVVTLLSELVSRKNEFSPSSAENILSSHLPLISADSRKNTVIVRDYEANFPLYRSLIASLDEVQKQIEISVSIIDVDLKTSKEVGMQSGIRYQKGSIALGIGEDAALSGKDGAYFSANIKDCFQFETYLKLLQEKSKANIIAQPSIITLNNLKAVLDKSTTFYTKVKSEYEAKLEAITSGTLLEVTPSITRSDPKGEKIQLQIHIKDGKFNLRSSSDLPEVQDSEMITQACLNEGEGLLLGGFVREETMDSTLSSPYLEKIPLLGYFFKSSRVLNTKVVRLFFIKASVIHLPPVASGLSLPESSKTILYENILEKLHQEAEEFGWGPGKNSSKPSSPLESDEEDQNHEEDEKDDDLEERESQSEDLEEESEDPQESDENELDQEDAYAL